MKQTKRIFDMANYYRGIRMNNIIWNKNKG